MRVSFQVSLGVEYLEVDPGIAERIDIDSNARAHAASQSELSEILDICCDPRISVLVSSITTFDDEQLEEFECYSLRSKRLIKLTDKAWDSNFHVLGELHPEEKGGWAPVSVPRSLVYATTQKKPYDIAHLMDACPELVVSTDVMEEISRIDGDVWGESLLQDAKLATTADEVRLLKSGYFAPVRVASASVGYFDGLALAESDPAHPRAELSDLGVPVLPSLGRMVRPRLMRSSEPWSTNLAPGWVASSEAAIQLSAVSREVVLNPIITEGTRLHFEHDSFWACVRRDVSERTNVSWEAPWEIQDLAPRLRRLRI